MSKRPCSTGHGLKKGAWTVEEDKKLISYIHEHGEGGWRDIPQKAGLERFGKSCRLRWTNYLKPYVKRGEYSIEEEQIIIMLHASLGNKWSVIARHLPKRTENDVKSYWNTHLKKRLINKEIDSVTHKLLASNPSSSEPKKFNSEEETNLDDHSSQSSSTSPAVTKLIKNQTEGSSSTSRLLNKLTARAASIGKIISTSMEETSKSPTSSSCLPNSFKEGLGTTIDFNSPEYGFSQLLEQFMNDDDITDNIGNEDITDWSDVPSTQVDEDITDWSGYLLDHPIFSDPFMARQSFTEP